MAMCTGVRASDVPVLDLEHRPDSSARAILGEVEKSVEQDGAQAVVLGCAGMANVVAAIREVVSVPVIDPIECAAQGMAWLAG